MLYLKNSYHTPIKSLAGMADGKHLTIMKKVMVFKPLHENLILRERRSGCPASLSFRKLFQIWIYCPEGPA